MTNKLTLKFNYKTLCILVLVILIIAKVFQFNFLPDKYFNDSLMYLAYMNRIPDWASVSYVFTVKFYRTLNFFKLDELKEWAILLTIIGYIYTITLLKKIKTIGITKAFFLFCSLFLLGVYAFNIGKEPIQIILFQIVTCVIINNHIETNKQVLIVICFFVIESYFFREYYAFIALIMLELICLNHFYKCSEKSFFIFLLTMIFLMLITVFVIKYISNEHYKEIIFNRESTNKHRIDSDNAQSIIVDTIKVNNEFLNWAINYIINLFRMMLPIELILKKISYVPFVIYQLFLSKFYVDSFFLLKKKNYNYMLCFCCFTAFLLVSFIFEPDFGSWIRHEITCFPLIMALFFDNQKLIS